MSIAIDNIWTCVGCEEEFIPRKDKGVLEHFQYVCFECCGGTVEHVLIMLRHEINDILKDVTDVMTKDKLLALVDQIVETQREFYG